MQWSACDVSGLYVRYVLDIPGTGYAEIDVSQALADPHSVFYTYQRLIALRKALSLLTYGDYHDLNPEGIQPSGSIADAVRDSSCWCSPTLAGKYSITRYLTSSSPSAVVCC
ncbi:MAG: hypothetical protein ACR5LD_06400 [Symbiopectobacterium sp.]